MCVRVHQLPNQNASVLCFVHSLKPHQKPHTHSDVEYEIFFHIYISNTISLYFGILLSDVLELVAPNTFIHSTQGDNHLASQEIPRGGKIPAHADAAL